VSPEERSDRERAEEREEARRLEKERAEKERPDTVCVEKALDCIWQLLTVAKTQVDPVTWRTKGGPEAEDFLYSIETALPHPVWRWYRKRIARGRPRPGLPKQRAQIFVVLMCAALERVGCGKKEARELAACALEAKDLFPDGPPSPHAIQRWQRAHGPLTAEDECFVVRAITRPGRSAEDAIVSYFVPLIHIVLDPTARLRLVRKDDESAR